MSLKTGTVSVELNATIHIRKMIGGSQSHLIVASDGEAYVAKAVDNPQHRHVPLYEWFISYVAARVGLSVASRQIINVSPSFIDLYPEYGAKWGDLGYRPYSSGRCFGSQFLGGLMPGITYDYLSDSSLSKVVNNAEFLGALVLDKWACNADARQAVFVLDRKKRLYRAHFIDHGYCFNGGRSKMEDAPLKGCYSHKSVYKNVRGWEDFEPWLERMRAIDASELSKGLKNTPSEWYDNHYVLEALIEVLDRRRRIVPDLIDSLRNSKLDLFPLWS